jgi:hypothetical protein
MPSDPKSYKDHIFALFVIFLEIFLVNDNLLKLSVSFIVLFAVILGTCVKATSQLAKEMINPGDKIGDFLITTGKKGEATYTWYLGCVKQGEGEEYSCKAVVGTKVNISVGIYDDTFSGKLDENWAGHM